MANGSPGDTRCSILTAWAQLLDAAGAPGVVELCEVPFLVQVNVRLDPRDRQARAAAADALGAELPEAPNTVASGAGVDVLWLGPDEWLAVADPGSESELVRRLDDAFDDQRRSVVDCTANRTILQLHGPAARDVLRSACPLDVHPRVFGPGQCAQTLFAKSQVILWQLDAVPTFRLLVRPSFARYAAELLCDAMLEWQDRATRPSEA